MRKLALSLSPLAAGVAPAAVSLGAAWSFGPAAAFLAAAVAGAAAFWGLARAQVSAAARALEDSTQAGAAQDFAAAFAAPAPALAPLYAPFERLRAALKQREADRDADIAARAAEAKRKKKDADAEAQGYIDAHEVFMKTFTAALTSLAEGDLSVRLDRPYSRDYEPLRHCFNRSLESLNSAFGATAQGVQGLYGSVDRVAKALGDVSERTGRQAASVEEASATLRSILTALAKTADEAKTATDAVGTTRRRAETGADIVARAVEAMRRIQKSAGEIEKIISVIDEIAFQTNLLALNAGVEAARAGETGKGFAVVASEVRALALRSAQAAKEIKALISASSAQVKEGVDLVGETGGALEAIVGLVAGANQTVAAIAHGAAEQKALLDAVAEAVGELDGFTQQNAAMLENADQAGASVRGEAAEIAEAVARFRLRSDPSPTRRAA